MCCDQILSRETLVLYLNTNRTYISEAVKVVTDMSFPQYNKECETGMTLSAYREIAGNGE